MPSINQNFFALFDLPVSFGLDAQRLADRYRELQMEVHPDKFAAAAEQDRMRAVQTASYLNEAYATLKSPIKRAAYLLNMQGLDTESVSQEDLGMDLLMEQMRLRESLDELPPDQSALPELDRLRRETSASLAARQQAFAAKLEQDELAQARKIFHEMQFLDKLFMEIEAAEERRLEY